jgi:uroporphyrinogen decarboxylase
MPMWLDFPVKSKLDWEKIKEERFNLNSINKRFHIDPDNLIKETKNCNMPVGVLDAPIGFFGTLRYLMGELNLFLMYHDEPLLIKDMCEHFCNLWIAVSEELTSKIDFDLACFWEDMSGKQGSLISPNTFKEFMQPYYNRLINFLKSRGVKLFLVDTDGDVSGLIPLFIESGINIMYPFEQQAGNDLIKIRKDYPRFGILGGFDKNTLFKGKDNIDKELEKMSYLISKGGYIPFCDHLVPPNCSWDSFKYYRNNLNNIIDSTGIL